SCFLSLAAFRTPFRPCDAAAPSCVGTARAFWTFSSVRALPSTISAATGGVPVALFDGFFGTTAQSDSSLPCMSDVRLSPSPAGLPLARAVGNEVSRFSCIQFRGVPGVSDYVGPPPGSRSSAATACCLPLQTTGSATSVRGFRSSIPCPSLPLSMLRTAPHDAPRKTRGQDGFAAPFLKDSFIPYCMPVHPGAPPVPPSLRGGWRPPSGARTDSRRSGAGKEPR